MNLKKTMQKNSKPQDGAHLGLPTKMLTIYMTQANSLKWPQIAKPQSRGQQIISGERSE